jgi:cytochrome P450
MVANKIQAMLMNPDVQTEAHRELDRVLAPGDLPNFSLEPDLPYITAIVREVFRYNIIIWYPIYSQNLSMQVSTSGASRFSTSGYR